MRSEDVEDEYNTSAGMLENCVNARVHVPCTALPHCSKSSQVLFVGVELDRPGKERLRARGSSDCARPNAKPWAGKMTVGSSLRSSNGDDTLSNSLAHPIQTECLPDFVVAAPGTIV